MPDTKNGGVAQLGEHLPCKQGVKSSNLSISICTEAERRMSLGKQEGVRCYRAGPYLENHILKTISENMTNIQDIRGLVAKAIGKETTKRKTQMSESVRRRTA